MVTPLLWAKAAQVAIIILEDGLEEGVLTLRGGYGIVALVSPEHRIGTCSRKINGHGFRHGNQAGLIVLVTVTMDALRCISCIRRSAYQSFAREHTQSTFLEIVLRNQLPRFES